jgi:hypothetical protein
MIQTFSCWFWGGRYGSIEPNSGKSFIELEYDYATNQRKSLFAAVINDAYLTAKVKAAGRDAIETTNGLLLEAFREIIISKICRFFDNVNELKLIVFESLANLERNEDLVGWIRGSDVIDPKAMLEEAARLQAENTSLRKRVEDWEALAAFLTGAGQRESAAMSLSDDARGLLLTAKNGDGYILYIRHSGGATIQAATRNFVDPQNHREEARWKAALDELQVRRLIEAVGYKGETFRLTKRGYEAADEIEATTRSNTPA